MKQRETRYQGAIVRNHQILLIQHREHESGRSYWILPGGGIEPGESEEECVRRELQEETNLDVTITSLLMNEPDIPGGVYRFRKTYLCEPVQGEAKPGFEPEADASSLYGIVEVRWFNLRDTSGWDTDLINDTMTYGQVQQVRRILGYISSCE